LKTLPISQYLVVIILGLQIALPKAIPDPILSEKNYWKNFSKHCYSHDPMWVAEGPGPGMATSILSVRRSLQAKKPSIYQPVLRISRIPRAVLPKLVADDTQITPVRNPSLRRHPAEFGAVGTQI
jgi:hypothetical protein